MNGMATRAVLIRWQIRRRMGQPLSSLCAPCVFPLLSFGVVAVAFESVQRSYLHGMRYVAYLVPLVILNTVLFGSAADGADAWREAGSAIVRRLASLDFDATAFAASRAIGYGVACALQTAVFAVALGLLTGLVRSGLGVVATVMLVTTFSVGVGAFATGLGFQSRAPDDAPGLLHALFLPLTFLSTAYVPTALFPAGVRLLVEFNPVSWLAQTSRALLSGTSPQLSQLLGVIAAATALCVVGLLFAHRSERRREAA